MPWPCLLAFLRIATNARICASLAKVGEAYSILEGWLKLPMVWIPSPAARHEEILGQVLRQSKAQGNLIYDAHLAALAIEHGLELCSADSDFARFEGLRWRNPLLS